MPDYRKVVNVYLTNSHLEHLSRKGLLAWVNRVLESNFQKIEELCTGAAYCQFLDMLFPGVVSFRKVKFTTNLEHENIKNFKLVQRAFATLGVKKHLDIETLSKGNFYENFVFLQWFKKFVDANNLELPYDALKARNGVPMGYGTSIFKGNINYKGRGRSTSQCRRLPTTAANRSLNRTASVLTVFDPKRETPRRSMARKCDTKPPQWR